MERLPASCVELGLRHHLARLGRAGQGGSFVSGDRMAGLACHDRHEQVQNNGIKCCWKLPECLVLSRKAKTQYHQYHRGLSTL